MTNVLLCLILKIFKLNNSIIIINISIKREIIIDVNTKILLLYL